MWWDLIRQTEGAIICWGISRVTPTPSTSLMVISRQECACSCDNTQNPCLLQLHSTGWNELYNTAAYFHRQLTITDRNYRLYRKHNLLTSPCEQPSLWLKRTVSAGSFSCRRQFSSSTNRWWNWWTIKIGNFLLYCMLEQLIPNDSNSPPIILVWEPCRYDSDQ